MFNNCISNYVMSYVLITCIQIIGIIKTQFKRKNVHLLEPNGHKKQILFGFCLFTYILLDKKV